MIPSEKATAAVSLTAKPLTPGADGAGLHFRIRGSSCSGLWPHLDLDSWETWAPWAGPSAPRRTHGLSALQLCSGQRQPSDSLFFFPYFFLLVLSLFFLFNIKSVYAVFLKSK